MNEPRDAWSPDWAELRKRTRLTWLLFFGYIPFVFLTAEISKVLGLAEYFTDIFAVPYTAFFVINGWRMSRFSCPRCGELFFIKKLWGFLRYQNPFSSGCMHCGLRKYTPSYSAKRLNKITDNWDSLF